MNINNDNISVDDQLIEAVSHRDIDKINILISENDFDFIRENNLFHEIFKTAFSQKNNEEVLSALSKIITPDVNAAHLFYIASNSISRSKSIKFLIPYIQTKPNEMLTVLMRSAMLNDREAIDILSSLTDDGYFVGLVGELESTLSTYKDHKNPYQNEVSYNLGMDYLKTKVKNIDDKNKLKSSVIKKGVTKRKVM